jgi:hypothetical protein
VEDALRLMTVEREVGGVQIQHHLGLRRGVRSDLQIDQQPVDGLRRVADLVISSRPACQFQPVQGAPVRQRLLQPALAAPQPDQRIPAQQLLMIAKILIAQRQP